MSEPTSPYSRELRLALVAVQRAALLTQRMLATFTKPSSTASTTSASGPAVDTIAKADATPVTQADFGAQALLVAAVHHAFPSDRIIGEESAAALRSDDALAESVWSLVQRTAADYRDDGGELSSPASKTEMLDLIDLGAGETGVSGGRVWTMDPVDGTRTYAQGGQYVVSLVLLIDGEQILAVSGCPHLSLRTGVSETDVARDGPGYLVSAVKGHGAWIREMGGGCSSDIGQPSRVLRKDAAGSDDTKKAREDLVFVESVTPEHPASSKRIEIAARLCIPWRPVDVYSTQLRYVALALGSSDVFLRVPRSVQYSSSIWDHAGGILILEEAGGRVTDLTGQKMDFLQGRTLKGNFGVVAAPMGWHEEVLQAVERVFEGDEDFARLKQKGKSR